MTTAISAQNHIAGHTADGRTIYHSLRWCNQIRRQFHFTLDPAGIDGESRYDMSMDIDVRNLPPEFLPQVPHEDLMAGRYPRDQRPVDWLIMALNAGWMPTSRIKACRTAEAVMHALNARLNGRTCPSSGSLGECPACYELDKYPGRYYAHVYIWKAGQLSLKPSTVAAWLTECGCTDVVIRQDMHDPDNDTYEGKCHDGALSWLVEFCL